MRPILVSALVVLLGGCSASAPTSIQAPSQANPDEFVSGKESWSIGCQPDQKDAYGELVEKSKCWAMVTYDGDITQGLSMIADSVFEVNDAKGAVLVTPKPFDTDVCGEIPRRKAVDGRPIHDLPMPQQIAAVTAGNMYTRETDRPWPHCNVYNEHTGTTGAKRAFDRMMAKWSVM
jgi:hypothetical protein